MSANKRYFSVARKVSARRHQAYQDDEDYYEISIPSITVHENDREPVKTGLLDQYGNTIYSVADRHPIGFHCPSARPSGVSGGKTKS